jgi:Ribonuclease G/E
MSDASQSSDGPARVKVRGIYTTSLTQALATAEDFAVVQPSPAIADRFDREFDLVPADATVWTTDDRQGVGVVGPAAPEVREQLSTVGRDTLTWRDAAPRGAVIDATVTETKGSGAIVDLGERSGFLPFSNSDDHVETGDDVRVQVTDPRPPWDDGRPVLDTTVEIQRPLVTLVRDGASGSRGQPELAELLPTDPPEGWRARWSRAADDASLDALGDALDAAVDRADRLDAALADAGEIVETPRVVFEGQPTVWVWFGRESRFTLDSERREVTTTMAGHHRIKAGDERASAAVDFVEAVCEGEGEFPFEAVTRQFGPVAGDTVAIDHGKPAGHCIRLGRGEVTDYDPEGTIRVEREMSPGGTYDALGIERQAGDVAVTKLTEGKWWYPTIYRGSDGEKRGTYVNVCTPVEIFPNSVRYVDLHVDVVKHADGTVERVDDDELDAAVEVGHVPEDLADKARAVASAVENALS